MCRRCCAGTVISPLLLGRDEVVDGLAFLESLLHLNQLLDAVDQQLHELALHTHNGRRRRDLQQLDDDETPRISALHTTAGSLAEWLASVAPPGGWGGSFPLWVDVQKLYNMCVLSLSWNFFVSHDKYIARPSSKEPRGYTDNTTGTGGLRTLDPL